MIKCSLIIPAYNAAMVIGQCLARALQQSIPREAYEVIVVDDGSLDNTAEVVAGHPAVKLIRQANRGPAAARNRGAEAAGGDILVFTDADCELEVDFLKNILAPFAADPQVAGAQGRYQTRQNEFMARFGQVEIETRYLKMERGRHIDFIGTYAAAYRADLFRQYGGFDPGFPAACGEDAEFSYRLSRDGHRMLFCGAAVVYHRHPSTLKQYLRTKFYRGFWRVRLHRKHFGKSFKDSYTPLSLKVEVAMAPVLPAVVGLSCWNAAWLPPALLILALYFSAALPFLRLFRKMKFSGGYLIPAVLYARAASIFAGICLGTLNELFRRKR